MTHDIFLSYAAADAGLAGELRDALGAQGVNCFMASKDIPAAADWEDSIRQALIEAHTVVVLLTPRSVKSDWVLMETGAAWVLNKRRMAALVQVDASEALTPLSRHQAMKIDTSAERAKFVETVALFERSPTTPDTDFEFRRISPSEWKVFFQPKNDIPFECFVTLRDENGKLVSMVGQAGYHPMYPEAGKELAHPLTFKLNSPYLRGRDEFEVVVTVTYRQMDGPFSEKLTKRYPMRKRIAKDADAQDCESRATNENRQDDGVGRDMSA